ncbi:MAG: hypothetical protein OEZ02_02695 [Anaerolineae bacterium]|nr:hypothetical protein [Anaerolineae bacterium]
MTAKEKRSQQGQLRQKSHMPEKSLFFEKVIPVLLAAMTILTVLLISFGVAILLGLINI